MRKFTLCFLLATFYAPCAVAADGVPSRAIPTSAPAATINREGVSDTARTIASRAAVSRVFTGNDTDTANVVRSGNRVVNLSDDDNSTRNVASTVTRGAASRVRTDVLQKSAREKLTDTVHTVGRSANDINSNPAVRRAGLTLRPTVAELGGRATIGDTGVQTGSNVGDAARAVTSRVGFRITGTIKDDPSKVNIANGSIADAKERLEQTADLNKSCQEQYNECMDQFCAVIDANQKRCSCSANLSRYTKVEQAVKDANTQLNDVAQRIRYVGLSADEIRAIMNATEAEEELSGKVDTTETRNMLSEIEELIKDPSSATSYSGDSFSGLDIDLDFSADATDLFNLDFLSTNGSFSNLRGTELYNAAKKRCNNIITQCKEVGATAQQITGNYDLAIDKDCIAYEQGLTKMNETLVSNVRSANLMLQKARLAVLQNKNQYDAKGCIAALDNCMRDDMVCGDDYTKCLDPTKRYIDENGNVILGQDISKIVRLTANYDNSIISDGALEKAYETSISETACGVTGDGSGAGACNIKYLLQKIGTKQRVTDEGLCRAVLDKCQRYTYDDDGNYIPYNDIVVNYIQRAMVNIRSGQRKIISDYSSSCMLDIAACYNQQVTQVNAWTNTANINSIYRVMRGACRNVALTCAFAVFDGGANWCGVSGTSACCPSDDEGTCIDNISEMFYQSLLCPDNSTYTMDSGTVGTDNYVNSNCQCNTGYDAFAGRCLMECDSGYVRNSSGTCVKGVSSGSADDTPPDSGSAGGGIDADDGDTTVTE